MRRVVVQMIISLVFCLLTAACSATKYAQNRPGALSIEKKKSGDPEKPYDLAYIEFDDQGDFWDPEQLDNALKMIDQVNESAGYDSEGNGIGSIFVTYVHGWRNDASEGNGNLANFKNILKRLAEDEGRAAESSTPPRPARPIAGVYVAWRGDALWTIRPLRWLDVFTFWNRNAAAARIASRPPATQALLLILKEIQGKSNARSIVVGHSMGALIVERAMSQALVGVITEAKYRKRCEACQSDLEPGEFKPPADLIVLVNSAAPAMQSKHLVEVLEEDVSESAERHDAMPLLLSITAQNDRATKRLFPVAMKLESRRQNFRSDTTPGQGSLVTHTAGHTPFLHSHAPLKFDADAACRGAVDDLPLNVLRCREEEERENSLAAIFTVGRRKYTIKRIAGAFNHTPYWILQAPDSVIDNHSGFFTDEFTNFLRGLIIVTGASRPDDSRVYSTAGADGPK